MENPKRPPTRPWRPLEGHQPSQKTGFSGFVPDCITRSGHAGHHWIALDHSYPLIFVSFLQLNWFWSYAQKMQIAKHDQDAKKWSGYICSFTAFFWISRVTQTLGAFTFWGFFGIAGKLSSRPIRIWSQILKNPSARSLNLAVLICDFLRFLEFQSSVAALFGLWQKRS